MTTVFTALILCFDLLFTPFVLGALTLGLIGRLTHKPHTLKAALLAGMACALVHAVGVFALLWRDGDWLGYFVMCTTAAAMAMLIHKSA
jgi:hypothetical protein